MTNINSVYSQLVRDMHENKPGALKEYFEYMTKIVERDKEIWNSSKKKITLKKSGS